MCFHDRNNVAHPRVSRWVCEQLVRIQMSLHFHYLVLISRCSRSPGGPAGAGGLSYLPSDSSVQGGLLCRFTHVPVLCRPFLLRVSGPLVTQLLREPAFAAPDDAPSFPGLFWDAALFHSVWTGSEMQNTPVPPARLNWASTNACK